MLSKLMFDLLDPVFRSNIFPTREGMLQCAKRPSYHDLIFQLLLNYTTLPSYGPVAVDISEHLKKRLDAGGLK